MGFLGLFALMLIGFAMDTSSSDDPDAESGPGAADTAGDEPLEVGPGDATLSGEGEADLFRGYGDGQTIPVSGNGFVKDGAGDEEIYAENAVDSLYGEASTNQEHGGAGGDDIHGDSGDEMLGGADFATDGESLDYYHADFTPDAEPATITDFDGEDDVLVLLYDDATDPDVSFSFTDNGGSGVTEVSLFGQVTVRLIGNVDDIGLTAENIAAVNVAFA